MARTDSDAALGRRHSFRAPCLPGYRHNVNRKIRCSSLGLVNRQHTDHTIFDFRFSIFDWGITDDYQGLDLAKKFHSFGELVSILTLLDDRVHSALLTLDTLQPKGVGILNSATDL